MVYSKARPQDEKSPCGYAYAWNKLLLVTGCIIFLNRLGCCDKSYAQIWLGQA